ncbi:MULTISPECIES: hypothetical protein [unclassified Pandoraea]|uniref:hypothetical protein n=1 Tax=unclassified Pandoraea TaxID=2624094 RepID=UPI00036347A4|nr:MULTISPECIES: hypothetical protein [unclassified Pandoraea]
MMRGRGHDVSYLSCDGALTHCYTRALRDQDQGLRECFKCTLGGIRSFTGKSVDSMRNLRNPVGAAAVAEGAKRWGFSGACTILRTESPEDKLTDTFKQLHARLTIGAAEAFAAATRWIESRNLDAIVCFNGRMEGPRGLMEAARAKGIPFISVERTWFGDGLLLIPDQNCLGLDAVGKVVAEYSNKPLTEQQARVVASLLAGRFLRDNTLEWRAYNRNAEDREWPAASNGMRLLITPSSLNEFDGHPDWKTQWPNQIAALDSLLTQLEVNPASCILRCHPNWGETIGLRDGGLAERMYTEWAQRRGVHVIGSKDRTSTLGLIAQTDAIVVNGGSAAFEGGALGKQIIALGTSIYQRAGFQIQYYGPDDAPNLAQIGKQSPDEIARKVLRFAYAFNFRFNQYVSAVRAKTTTHYLYDPNVDGERLERLIQNRRVSADDDVVANDTVGEDRVLALLTARNWAELREAQRPIPTNYHPVNRRGVFRWIDEVRDRMPIGDR